MIRIGLFLATNLAILILLGIVMNILEPTWIPPQITRRVPLEVHLVPEYMLVSMLFLILLSILTAITPARKAAGMDIVDALGHA